MRLTRPCSAPDTDRFVETPDGQVYHTHLCSRPLKGVRLLPAPGGQVPAGAAPAPFAAPTEAQPSRQTYSFSPDASLPLDFQWLRTPHPERIFSLAARPGWLRLYVRESIGSWFEQALVARRQEHFVYRAENELDFP